MQEINWFIHSDNAFGKVDLFDAAAIQKLF